jgi:tripartite-type tricarboxylate transporter receptor subunit TctC
MTATPICRRRLLRGAGLAAAWTAAAAWAALPRAAWPQPYPARPVRLVVGFPVGGPNDIQARLVGQALSERLGQPVVVENRPGASGNVATEMVAAAPPDGHTLLLVGPANAIHGAFQAAKNPAERSRDVVRGIALVAGIAREPLVMVVHPSVPATTVAEFVVDAYARPGRITMASTGKGSSPHLTGELFRMMAGVDLAVVHYAGGGPALKEMIAGNAQVMFEPMSAAIEPVRAGKLRALAVSTAARSDALPGIPTVAETVRGYEASAATGIGVPSGTPAEVISRLNHEINAALAEPAFAARLAAMGASVLAGSPADFTAVIADEITKWAKVVAVAGVTPD